MEKLYGYKNADVFDFATFIKEKKGTKLLDVFEEFAIKSGKSKGTIRNLYYEIVRLSNTDKDFCQKYFNGTPLKATKIQSFDKEQEQWLLQGIIKGIRQGKSVRSVVCELANGDLKLALRYQNKYRSMLVKSPDFAREIKQEGQRAMQIKKDLAPCVSEKLLERLKKEVNALVDKIALKEKKENDYLKRRVAFLEQENLKLSKLIYGGSIESQAIKYFSSPNGEQRLH